MKYRVDYNLHKFTDGSGDCRYSSKRISADSIEQAETLLCAWRDANCRIGIIHWQTLEQV